MSSEQWVSGVSETDIAIIGMACRFPGAGNLEVFWDNLREGVESITWLRDEEIELEQSERQILANPNYVKAAPILKDIEWFDAAFFGYTPREAEVLSPQHRLLLESVWEALEHAGCEGGAYQGRVGVYIGASTNTYFLGLYQDRDVLESQGPWQIFAGNDPAFLATWVSYKLDLHGPSYTVQTACSSALVAAHLACQSVLTGECQVAVVGGASVEIPHKVGYVYQDGGIVSAHGRVRTFDAQADGTVFGSGVGVVVLKRLVDALAQGDQVYAVIKGSAINNDGALKASFTAPSVRGQTDVILDALANAEVHPETIGYVEAHGTGTALGDPIEVAALTKAYRVHTSRTGFCRIGSVKTNIGHVSAAAGIAGLIKTVLALEHKQIPASLHFEQPNPKIDFAAGPFFVNTELTEWQTDGGPRRAGVNSLGFGGTNAHVILEEAPQFEASESVRLWHLLTLSAKTPTALEAATDRLVAHLKRRPELPLADVAYTLQAGRKAFSYRRTLSCQSVADAIEALERRDPHRVYTNALEQRDRPVVFLFPGQGAQHVGMGQQVYHNEPIFREQVDQCCEALKPHVGLDLRDVLFASDERAEAAQAQLNQTRLSQPALFVIEYALARLWMAWGIKPHAMLGHSIGEYVAACLAGVFSLEDGLELVAARGRLMQSMPSGAMLSVFLPEEEVRPWLGEGLSLAAVNGPSQCVVSGRIEKVEVLERRLERDQVNCRRLHTSHAFHSAMMEPIVPEFAQRVRAIRLHPPQLAYLSNVSGGWIDAQTATEPEYWARHLRQPVRFAEGVYELLKEPDRMLVEVGPGNTLSKLVQAYPGRATKQVVLPSLPHPQDSQSSEAFLLSALGQLWAGGLTVDWPGLYTHEKRQRQALPAYPFERKRYWVKPALPGARSEPRPVASQERRPLGDWYSVPVWKQTPPPVELVAPPAHGPAGCWLVFGDDSGVASGIVERLQQAGLDVVVVKPGAQFEQIQPGRYTLNPQHKEAYGSLLEELSRLNLKLHTIVHLWSVGLEAAGGDLLEQVKQCGFYSLLNLVQSLAKHDMNDAMQLKVVSNNMHKLGGEIAVYPEKALLVGVCKVIPQEYPHIQCACIDMALPASGSLAADDLDLLVAELASHSADGLVAYRNQQRWVQGFEALHLDAVPGRPSRLREGGVYLITGGLGGIGLSLAGYLANTLHAKLILTGQSSFPSRAEWPAWLAAHPEQEGVSAKIRQLQALEAAGAQVLAFSADVADRAQMDRVLREARERFGTIHGVIHAAGLPGGGLIQLKTSEIAERVFRPKVKGALVLRALLEGAPLDFFMVCSSILSVAGGLGQVDYCAANAFLDAFAHSLKAQQGIAVNWGGWEQVGMAAKAAQAASPLGRPIVSMGHPLLDECIAETSDQIVFLSRFSASKLWVLSEHRVAGTPTLPGTAYVEMIRAAVERIAEGRQIELREVAFLTPLQVQPGQERQVLTHLRKEPDGYVFRIVSKAPAEKEGGWLEHARGSVGFIAPQPPRQHVVKSIAARCTRQVIETKQPASGQTLTEWGPRWALPLEAYWGATEGLLLLDLPEEFRHDLDKLKLHPALLDLASKSLAWDATGSYLPLTYEKLRVQATLPGRIYSHIHNSDHGPGKPILTADIVIMDERGVELVVIEQFTMKRVGEADAQMAAKAQLLTTAADTPDRQADVFYDDLLRAVSSQGIRPAEGVEAFARIMARRKLTQVVVSPLELSAVMRQASQLTPDQLTPRASAVKPLNPRPALRTAYVAPRTELEQSIANVVQKLLGLERVGVEDNFFELGGHSLLAMELVSTLRRTYQVQLSTAQLFELPTVANFGQAILTQQGQATESEALAQALAEIERLSDEEIEALLAEEESPDTQ